MKKYFFYFTLIWFLAVFPVFGQTIASEIIGFRAQEGCLLIDVAKKYPEVKFSFDKNQNNILIELLNSRYHEFFKFDELGKNELLNSLSFVKDFTVNTVKDKVTGEKIDLVINVKESTDVLPKLVSTKNNIVKLSFYVSKNELYNKGREEHVKGNYEQAEKFYKEAISRDQNSFFAKFNLAKLYSDKGLYDESVSLLILLLDDLQKLPQNAQTIENVLFVQNALGSLYILKGDLDKASEIFGEIINVNPEQSLTYYNLGLIYEKKKDLEKSKLNFLKAVELNPDFAESYYHIAVIELINKNKNEAISSFKKVVELSPGSKIAELSQDELNKIGNKSFKLFR